MKGQVILALLLSIKNGVNGHTVPPENTADNPSITTVSTGTEIAISTRHQSRHILHDERIEFWNAFTILIQGSPIGLLVPQQAAVEEHAKSHYNDKYTASPSTWTELEDELENRCPDQEEMCMFADSILTGCEEESTCKVKRAQLEIELETELLTSCHLLLEHCGLSYKVWKSIEQHIGSTPKMALERATKDYFDAIYEVVVRYTWSAVGGALSSPPCPFQEGKVCALRKSVLGGCKNMGSQIAFTCSSQDETSQETIESLLEEVLTQHCGEDHEYSCSVPLIDQQIQDKRTFIESRLGTVVMCIIGVVSLVIVFKGWIGKSSCLQRGKTEQSQVIMSAVTAVTAVPAMDHNAVNDLNERDLANYTGSDVKADATKQDDGSTVKSVKQQSETAKINRKSR